jgi:hypothetical protein
VSKILEGTDLVRDPGWDIFSSLCNSTNSLCWQLDRQVGLYIDRCVAKTLDRRLCTGRSQEAVVIFVFVWRLS